MGNRIARCAAAFGASEKHAGYTLIELIVVIALISLVLFVTVPRFQTARSTDDIKAASRYIMIKTQSLKNMALQENKRYIMVINVNAGRIWIADDTMSEEEREKASRTAFELTDDLRITDVAFPDRETVGTGLAEIYFHPGGYSDKALIHMQDADGDWSSLLIEPFLPTVKFYDDNVSFEE